MRRGGEFHRALKAVEERGDRGARLQRLHDQTRGRGRESPAQIRTQLLFGARAHVPGDREMVKLGRIGDGDPAVRAVIHARIGDGRGTRRLREAGGCLRRDVSEDGEVEEVADRSLLTRDVHVAVAIREAPAQHERSMHMSL